MRLVLFLTVTLFFGGLFGLVESHHKPQENSQFELELTSQLPGGNWLAVGQDGYAYIIDGNTFKVVDISNSAFPAIIGTLPLNYLTEDSPLTLHLRSEGHNVYIITGLRLLIVDVSIPTNPVLLGVYDDFEPYVSPGGDVYYPETIGIAVYNDTVYVSLLYLDHCPEYGRLAILDVSNPAQPTPLNSLDLPEGVGDLAINNQNLFALSGNELLILNIQDPSQPYEITRFYLDIFVHHISSQLIISSNRAYVTSYEIGLPCLDTLPRWQVIDISRPATPVILTDKPRLC